MTVEAWAHAARARLASASFAPSLREVWLLLSHVLDRSEAQVMARSREPLEPAHVVKLEELLARRLRAEPMAYLLGSREFYGRQFLVDARVLIPRPETEHLIEAALALPLPASPRLLDLGTGSGCLAVTLALEIRGPRVVAVDRSCAALAVARTNAARLGARDRVRWLAGDLAEALVTEGFDLVVSNPPYVPTAARPDLSPEVRDFEPSLALFAGTDGLEVLDRLLALAFLLRPGAWLIFEIGDGQLPALAAKTELLYPGGEVQLVESRADYAGKPRVVVLKRA